LRRIAPAAGELATGSPICSCEKPQAVQQLLPARERTVYGRRRRPSRGVQLADQVAVVFSFGRGKADFSFRSVGRLRSRLFEGRTLQRGVSCAT